nr:olfactory receptor 14 [Gregopimpla kuwanae]
MTKEHTAMGKSIKWNSDSVYALGLCRIMAGALGIWPLIDDFFSRIRVFIVAFSQVYLNVSLIRALVMDCGAMNKLVDSVALIACSSSVFLKIVTLRINQRRMFRIVSSALEDWCVIQDAKSRKVMKSYAGAGRFVFILQICTAYLGSIPRLIYSLPRTVPVSAIITNETVANLTATGSVTIRGLPMGAACTVANVSSQVYVAIYVLQIVQFLVTASGNIGSDVYFFGVAMHVCAQFELLKTRFEDFGRDAVTENDKCVRDQLIVLVKRHNFLAGLSDDFESTFSIIILTQLTVNAMHLSLLGIRLILGIRYGETVGIIYVCMAIYVLTLQLYLYCYAGEYLSSLMEDLGDAAFKCCWYNLSPTIIKDLLFVVLRSQCPFYLTAGKFYAMNIENFKNIVKAIASYFSFLKLMID